MELQYVRESLTEDEEIIHAARFHWTFSMVAVLNIVYGVIGAIIVIVLGVKFQPGIMGYVVPEGVGLIKQIHLLHPGVKIFSFLVILFGIWRFMRMMVFKATTEVAITNIRLIFKVGLVARKIEEIQADRIEGVDVYQGFFGRLLGYGYLIIRGMGIGELYLPPIEDPMTMRKAIDRARSI